jgi:hypothetical protein
VIAEAVEIGPDVVDGLAFGVEHQATQIDIDVNFRFEESEERVSCHGSPVATYTKMGQTLAARFFQVDGTAFF